MFLSRRLEGIVLSTLCFIFLNFFDFLLYYIYSCPQHTLQIVREGVLTDLLTVTYLFLLRLRSPPRDLYKAF